MFVRREAAAADLPTTMTGSGAALLWCAGLQRLPLPAGRGCSPSAACGTSLNTGPACVSVTHTESMSSCMQGLPQESLGSTSTDSTSRAARSAAPASSAAGRRPPQLH